MFVWAKPLAVDILADQDICMFDNISPSIRLLALVSRLCVVDEPKFRMIHDLMF
ncbi:unnamed protein product, partial [Ectocarpus fasciculatus]